MSPDIDGEYDIPVIIAELERLRRKRLNDERDSCDIFVAVRVGLYVAGLIWDSIVDFVDYSDFV